MMYKHTRRHNVIMGIIGSLMAIAAVAVWADYYYHAPGPLPEPRTVIFKKGKGFREIVDDLAAHDVIRHKWLFTALAVGLGDARRFKAGEYKFSSAISPRLVMDMIAEGRVVVRRLLVPEGFTSREVIALLDGEDALEGRIVEVPPEGSLLPQTYHFTYGDSRSDLVARMQEGMTSTLAELWAKRKASVPLATPQEALTLASIVEKETGVADERGRVAAVFINRLRKGMKLQSDPTVIYGIEKDKGPLGRPLTGKDLGHESPYNTYIIPALPPGPIANPGRAALEATLNPPETNDFYFVATGTGGHNFSESLKVHNKNVGQYRKELGAQKKKKEEKTPAKKAVLKEKKQP